MPATAPFTPKALAFLRALKRNNRREWFHERRDEYEQLLRRPMMAVIEGFGHEFRRFAPDLMADPKKSVYRIWRDTRFSADKRPLKTNVAAVFPHRLRRPAHLCRPVSGDRARVGVCRRRSLHARPAGAASHSRAHRGGSPSLSAGRQRPGIEAGRRTAGRVAQARATRLSRGSSGRRLPEDEAVPGLGRVAARAGDDAEVLDGAAHDVSRDRAAAELPERRAGTPYARQSTLTIRST